MLKHAQLVLLVIIITCSAPPLYAAGEEAYSAAAAGQDKGKGEETGRGSEARLEEVVVTATRQPSPAKELPVRTEVISRKEIEQSHANDLSELLIEKLPGHFHKYPGALSSVEIRGFRTDTTGTDIKGRVAILIDGHRAGTGNIAVIPLENVERIEIVRGPGSVVYGSAAMGGVINIITRKGQGKPSVSGGIEYGSWEHLKATAGASSGFWDDKAGISLTARNIQNQDYDTGDGRRIENTQYRDEAYSLSLHAGPSANHTFFATGHYFRAWDVGTPGPTYAPTPDDTKDVLRHYASLGYDGGLPGSDLVWHLSFYDVFDRTGYNYPGAAWGYSSSTTETETRGMRSQLSLPTFSIGRLLVGFDWDNIGVSSFTKPSGHVWTPDSQYDNYAVFAEEKIDWNRFSFLLGLRYDYFNEKLDPTEGLTVLSKDENFDHLSWRTGAKYSFLDWLSARAAVGTGFRAPAADELAGRFEQSMSKIIGNPDLKPETSTTYEAGLDAEYGGLGTGLGFFYTDYTDRISGGFSTCVDGDCSWTTYKNVEGATLSGIEAYLKYQIPIPYEDKTIRITPFTDLVYYTQRKLEDAEYALTLGSDTLPYVSQANLTGGIQLDFNRKADLQFTAVYHGPQEVQDWNWTSPTYGKAVDKGGFTLFSTRFSVHPVKYFNVYLALDNLADKSYSFVNGYPMPGRTVRVGLEARY